jgi:hypothetical protein
MVMFCSFSSSLFAGSRVDPSQSNVPSIYICEFPLLFSNFLTSHIHYLDSAEQLQSTVNSEDGCCIQRMTGGKHLCSVSGMGWASSFQR